MALIRSFKDLRVWQEAHRLVLMTYRATKKFPRDERFGLTQQFQRAAVSIPANIAEGYGRQTTKELLQSLAIANGSLEEARYHAFLGYELGYISRNDYEALEAKSGSVARLISALARSLRSKTRATKAPATGHRPPTTKN